MENCFEKARELGQMILESEISIRLTDARTAYEADGEALALMAEYINYQNDIKNRMEQGTLSKEEFADASKYMSNTALRLKQHPIAGEFIRAENDFNLFINQIIGILKSTITGTPDDGCEGKCDKCSGC